MLCPYTQPDVRNNVPRLRHPLPSFSFFLTLDCLDASYVVKSAAMATGNVKESLKKICIGYQLINRLINYLKKPKRACPITSQRRILSS
jgi:hypothetical protein